MILKSYLAHCVVFIGASCKACYYLESIHILNISNISNSDMGEPVKSDNIFRIILESKASLCTIVDSWIESYRENKTCAVIALIQFIIDSSGCSGSLTSLDEDFGGIIKKLTENFNESTSEYPLVQNGVKWRKFKASFGDFMLHLIRGFRNSILYDDFVMPKLITFLTALTDSQVRAFRHTSTYAVLKLMTALTEVYNSMSAKLLTSRRQYEVEESKSFDVKSSEKIEHLRSINKELEENFSEVCEMINYLFKAVFVLRFRDIVSKIRVLCISEIGLWMRKSPNLFLDDSYLKYLGWSLSDKVSEVRLTALLSLEPLCEINDLRTRIELFVCKFKDRIVSMTLDVDYLVAVQAVKLISGIIDHFNSIFTDKDTENIYQLVYSTNGDVAQAAGEFLSKKLEIAATHHPIRTGRIRKLSPHTFIIKELIDFFMESEMHDHAAYLVDSLLQTCEALRDWECMTNLLLENDTEDSLSPQKEGILIDIMVCSLKQIATGVSPTGRTTDKKNKTQKALKMFREMKEKSTEHFSNVLPSLINKFSSDSVNLLNLLKIPLYYDLSAFLSFGLNDNVTSLLNSVKYILERCHDTDILEACVHIFEYLSNEGHVFSSMFESYLNSVIKSSLHAYCSSMIEWSQISCPEENDDLKFLLVTSTKRIALLFSSFDLRKWDLWNIVFKSLEEKASEGSLNFPDECIKYSMSCCYFHILWDMHSFEDQKKLDEAPEIKLKLQSFMDLAEFILKNGSYVCAEEAYLLFCDLLLIFMNKPIKSNSNHPETFITASSRKIRDLLFSFLRSNVFIHKETSEISELYQQRILVSSYCKLFIYGHLPVFFLSDLLLYYEPTFTDFGDILYITILKARDLDIVDLARAMINALISLFEKIKSIPQNYINTEEFHDLQKISRKFASFLKPEGRTDVFLKALHQEGIHFAMRNFNGERSNVPENICFFELLLEFSSKLNEKNMTYISEFLNKYIYIDSDVISNRAWQPLINYNKSLKVIVVV